MSEVEQEPITVPKKDSVKQKVILVIAVLLAVSLLSFIVQNFNRIKIDFLMFEFRVRIIYLMMFSTLVGVVGTYAFQKYLRKKKKKK